VIRAVLDTNTIASGAARFRDGTSPPVMILQAWILGRFEMLISEALLKEVISTLSKPYFVMHVDPEVHVATLAALRDEATVVALTAVVSGVATHSEDDLVLATAVSAAADYLVTGDRQLQKLGQYLGVAIISPRDFLTRLETRVTLEQREDSEEDAHLEEDEPVEPDDGDS
jgi:putative PIN family toxin of toxin-antitoxin system